jgi:periplasmic divalent cation tolerance protein
VRSPNVSSHEVETIVIFTTTPTKADARKIVKELVSNRLAACASILPGLESVFRWKGKVNIEPEFLVIVKTRRNLFEEVAKQIEKLHPYDVPEIIALTVSNGSSKYLKWVEENTNKRH